MVRLASDPVIVPFSQLKTGGDILCRRHDQIFFRFTQTQGGTESVLVDLHQCQKDPDISGMEKFETAVKSFGIFSLIKKFKRALYCIIAERS